MNYSNNTHINKCVNELAELLNPENNIVTRTDVDRAIRLLRPSKGSTEHTTAIRARIRQTILNQCGESNPDGQLLLNKFEKQCDLVRKVNPNLLSSFLAILQPLSFRAANSTQVKPFVNLTERKNNTDGSFSNFATGAAALSVESKLDETIEEQTAVDSRVFQSDLVWVTSEVEHLLLVDLIYVLQGITGKHIKFDSRSESYLVDPSLKLNSSVRDTVLCICELGWLYGRVSAYLKSTFAVATDSNGVVVQAFGFALQEELHDYYRLLAVLEQELQRTTPGKTTSSSLKPSDLLQFRQRRAAETTGARDTEEESARKGGVGGSRSAAVDLLGNTNEPTGLTLLRLKAWLQEPIERMCQMARMVDGALPLRGGALVSRLYAHTQHGDPSTQALVRRVLDSVCAPLYTVLSRWVLYGELQDPHLEFFVMLNGNNNVRNIWRDTYILQHSMLPAYFSHTLAHKILLIGKSINFVRLCLQKLPRVTAKDEEIDAKRNGTSIGTGVRKSYRGVNKGKSLGLHGQIVTAGEDSVFFPEDGDGDADAASIAPDDTLMQMQMVVPSSTRSSSKLSAVPTPTAAGGTVPPTPNATTAAPAAGVAVAGPKRTLSMADVLGGVVTAEVQSALQNLRFGGEATLQDIVFKLSASIDTKLLNLMMSRFYVQTHLLALKKFMLLGQGDFVTCLMDGVGPELKRRANQLFRHNLTGILEGALRASNAQFEPSYVLDRIGIRLLEASPGDSGWEIFSLDYSIDAPLNAVVHMDCISKYRIAFHMLWRLKRVEWSLSTTWKQHTMFNHANRAFIPPSLRAVFHRCYLNRAMMMHVVNNLCAFLMFEVLETSWLKLQETIGRARCLDDVISAHDAYLSEVLDKALLAPHHEDLNMQVQQLLHIVLKFCNLEEALIGDATASIARRNLNRGGGGNADGSLVEERRRQAQRGGGLMEPQSPAEGEYDGVPAYVVQRIDEAVKEYSRQFDTLMHMLKEQGEKAGEILRFLTFRLDFNDFHLQQRAYGGHVGLTSTPPAHLKSRPVNIFSTHAGGAAGSDPAQYGESSDGDRLAGSYQQQQRAGSRGGAPHSPVRSESPTFGGPEAWTVGDSGRAGPASANPVRSKPKLSGAGSKYMR